MNMASPTQPKEEIPNLDPDGFPLPTYKTKLLVLSGESKQACEQHASDLAHYLQQKAAALTDGDDPDAASLLLQNISYTLDQRRRHTLHPWVAAGVVPFTRGLDAVVALLLSNNNNPASSMFAPSHVPGGSPPPRIGFVFPDTTAAAWHATSMARELVPSYPAFKAALKEGEEHLRALGAGRWGLLEELSATSRVGDDPDPVVEISVPLCVALQIALARLLRVWGVVPAAGVGSGGGRSGEIAASWAADKMSYAEAMRLAYHHGVGSEGAAARSDPDHWVGELTGAVVDVVVVVGPQLVVDSVRNPALPWFACLERGVNARDGMQMLAARLLRAGQAINMEAVNFPYGKWPHLQLLDDLPPHLWE
jgi:acyl transferase domain-containing protein